MNEADVIEIVERLKKAFDELERLKQELADIANRLTK